MLGGGGAGRASRLRRVQRGTAHEQQAEAQQAGRLVQPGLVLLEVGRCQHLGHAARALLRKLHEQRERARRVESARVDWHDGTTLPYLGETLTLVLDPRVDGVVLDETTPQAPLNSYGASKRAIEDMLKDFGAAHGLRSVIFRYFNVAGADPEAQVGEFHQPETHLIPVILEAIDGKRPALTINGTDYDTRYGTCVRDYVHVMDLVDAHVLGLKWLRDGRGRPPEAQATGGAEVFCLGTGSGFSVREVIDQATLATNHAVPMTEGPRREGDAVSLVSGSARAGEVLGWRADRSTLPQMIGDAWRWHQTGGYGK